MPKRNDKKYLIKIPVLGRFFKFIKENRKHIEKTLETGKETKGRIKVKQILDGVLTVTSQKTFNLLKKNEKRKR